MLRQSLLLGVLCLFILSLGGCGGGGGGSGGGNSGLPVGLFSKTIDYTIAGQGNWSGLFSTSSSGSRYQGLVLASALGVSGNIGAITFEYGADSALNTCPNVTMTMAHTSVATLGTTYANNLNRGTPQLVYQAASVEIPAGTAGETVTLVLDTPFGYNGVDNLIIDISTATCSGLTTLKARAASPAYTALIWNISNPAATTGTTWNALASMQFDFEGGTKLLISDNAAGNRPAPFDISGAQQTKVQMLYTADEIEGSGTLTGIGFPLGVATSVVPQAYSVTVRVAHTNKTDLEATFANNPTGSFVTVASDAVVNVPANAPIGEIIWLPLDADLFQYNGSGNLLVEVVVDVSTATGETAWRTRAGNANVVSVSGMTADVTGAAGNVYYDLALRFKGDRIQVVQATTGAINVPFSNSNPHKVQYLYNSTQLGVKGQITEIAFRASLSNWASGNADIPNLQFVLGQTDNPALVATMADNLQNPVTVFSGTLSFADTIMAGDWIVIPLSTPYTLDPSRNLVIQSRLDVGSPVAGIKNLNAHNGVRFSNYIGGDLIVNPTTITINSSSQLDLQLKVVMP